MLVQIGLIFGVVVVLMVLKVPIAFAFGVGAAIMVLVFNIDPEWVISTSFDLEMSYAFLALPLYLLLGSVLDLAKMGDRVSDFVVTAIGRLKGGLGVALVVTCGLFGAVSGLAMSALVSIGRGFLPAAEREGYPIPYTTGLLVSAAILAILIPPSGNMILFGFMGRLPISLCFLAPLIPGVILMFFLSAVHPQPLCRR
ncbi:unnamed protein product [marine sediment metagenome]|uniref:TRAP C4-dicarboxylate transport system permease DctM subunit domain-containing protein n=1 Tax=marine sediment metagenome TaxID=412755 RepID=X1GBA7_9ZZZZ